MTFALTGTKAMVGKTAGTLVLIKTAEPNCSYSLYCHRKALKKKKKTVSHDTIPDEAVKIVKSRPLITFLFNIYDIPGSTYKVLYTVRCDGCLERELLHNCFGCQIN